MKKLGLVLLGLMALGALSAWGLRSLHFGHNIGEAVDSLNSVMVYYNGPVSNVSGRNRTKEGYNLGLKYQCVEFVKRYYYEHLKHKMPNTYGHAKDFYDKRLRDGEYSTQRALVQFSNGSRWKPQVDDLVIFDGSIFNAYGHVAIVSEVREREIEIIQQNPGPLGASRAVLSLDEHEGKWKIKDSLLLGWLRKR